MSSKQPPAGQDTRDRQGTSAHSEESDSSADGASSSEARWRRTAIAAFYRAEARGFAPGRELEDWLEAEREVAELEVVEREAGQTRHSKAAAEPGSVARPGIDAAQDTKTPPRKRASGKRGRATRGPTMQARNRGDES